MLGALALALVVAASIWLTYPGGDTRFAIGWGNAIVHGDVPSFDGIVPTKHPLTLAIGTLFSIPGDEVARVVFQILSITAFVGLGAAIFRLGMLVASPAAGALACILVLTRPEVTDQAFAAGKELPFVALSVLALIFALEGARENRYKVLAALGAAGLIRPEAWLLAGIYAAWVWWLGLPEGASRRALLLAALAAPLIWIASDLLLTGDPFHSFAHEAGKQEAVAAAGYEADINRQDEAFSRAGDNLDNGISTTIGWPLAIAGLIIMAVSLIPGLQARSYRLRGWTIVAAIVIGVTVLGTIALPIFDQPFAARFFLLPGVLLVTLAATSVATVRPVSVLGAVMAVAAVFVAINLPGDISDAADSIETASATRDQASRWLALGEQPQVKAAANECERRAVISNERRQGPFARVSLATGADLAPDSFKLGTTGEVLGPKRATLVLDKPEGERPVYLAEIKRAELEAANTYVRDGRWAFVSAC